MGLLLLVGGVFFSCNSNTNTATQPVVEEVDENTVVLSDNQTSVIWLKDNQGERKMNRELFGAPDSLIESLGLQEGIPSSVSTFLMTKTHMLSLAAI
jgi:hypothetical protein